MAGVVLAAGASRRFHADRPKQLADFHGETLVHRAVRTACRRLDPVLLVVGHRGDEVRVAVDDLVERYRLRVVTNADWSRGQSTSVRAAVEALTSTAASTGRRAARSLSGALFLPCDQPGLDVGVLDVILASWRRRAPSTRALVPAFGPERRRGAPVLFASTLFPRLRSLSGDEGGRQILAALGDGARTVELPDAVAGDDVDTVADLERLRARLAPRAEDSS